MPLVQRWAWWRTRKGELKNSARTKMGWEPFVNLSVQYCLVANCAFDSYCSESCHVLLSIFTWEFTIRAWRREPMLKAALRIWIALRWLLASQPASCPCIARGTILLVHVSSANLMKTHTLSTNLHFQLLIYSLPRLICEFTIIQDLTSICSFEAQAISTLKESATISALQPSSQWTQVRDVVHKRWHTIIDPAVTYAYLHLCFWSAALQTRALNSTLFQHLMTRIGLSCRKKQFVQNLPQM